MPSIRNNQAPILATLVLAMLAAFALADVLTMRATTGSVGDTPATAHPVAPAASPEAEDPMFGNVPPGA